MRKLLILISSFALVTMLAVPVFAQETAGAGQEAAPKAEKKEQKAKKVKKAKKEKKEEKKEAAPKP